MSGAILNTGENPIVTASYEERVLHGRHRRIRCTLQVPDDGWLTAIDQLAFELAKARIGMLRDRSAESAPDKRDPLRASGSRGADRTLVEAQSWAACSAFLAGYAAQIEHHLSAKGSDRERALEHYCAALEAQPGYTRAAYNRAALLYNRYLPTANEEAIDCFAAATAAEDPRGRALALAGLAMAYCQAANRFGEDPKKVVPKVIEASEAAAELAPALEEARFARAWAHQLRREWDEAVAAYDAVVQDADATPPARRIASFCANNAGWILLTYFPDDAEALKRAELFL